VFFAPKEGVNFVNFGPVMTASQMEIATHHFTADDGADLVWHETGEGRPVVLIHGLFSDAATNWVKYGAAAEIVARGFRLRSEEHTSELQSLMRISYAVF